MSNTITVFQLLKSHEVMAARVQVVCVCVCVRACVCMLVKYIQFNEECSCAVVFPGMCHGKMSPRVLKKISFPKWKPYKSLKSCWVFRASINSLAHMARKREQG